MNQNIALEGLECPQYIALKIRRKSESEKALTGNEKIAHNSFNDATMQKIRTSGDNDEIRKFPILYRKLFSTDHRGR